MSKVIGAYKSLWRASSIAFHGDIATLNAARQQIRAGFRDNSNDGLSTDEVAEKIQYAFDIATILRKNVVQASPKDDSNEKYGR